MDILSLSSTDVPSMKDTETEFILGRSRVCFVDEGILNFGFVAVLGLHISVPCSIFVCHMPPGL